MRFDWVICVMVAAWMLVGSPGFAATTTTARSTTSAAGGLTSAGTLIFNPIRLLDTADPGVVRHGGKWYVYHTGGGRSSRWGRYPIAVSDNLVEWKTLGAIFSVENVPAWASESRNWWAPEVHEVGGKFIAYYTARWNDNNRFAVGAAVADNPAGPFKDVGAPIASTQGVGLIDVTLFQDPNSRKPYLIWKEDRNDFNPPEPTPIIMQEMTSDGLNLVGESREILRNDQAWEGVLVEAPSLIFHGGWYYLFYSGNAFAADAYAVGVARSRKLWGQYEKRREPILRDNQDFSGPGHQFVIQDEKGTWHMFYHARLKNQERSWRYLMHDVVTFDEEGWPRINDGHPGRMHPDALRRAEEESRNFRRR